MKISLWSSPRSDRPRHATLLLRTGREHAAKLKYAIAHYFLDCNGEHGSLDYSRKFRLGAFGFSGFLLGLVMTQRFVVKGKVMHTPTVGRYDAMKPKPEVSTTVATDTRAYSRELVKDRPSTRDTDYALLVRLGVNGEVPLVQAMVNAGLVVLDGLTEGSPPKRRIVAIHANNDNYAVSAKAA